MTDNRQDQTTALVQPTDAELDSAAENLVHTGSPVVHVAGDWHGHGAWAIARVMSAGSKGIRFIFHAGDFGIWPGKLGKKYLLNLDKACARFGVTLVVTPGNHEDWGRLSTLKVKDRGNGLGAVQWVGEHIAVLPRGHRLTLVTPNGNRRTFVSLGGAPSIDFATRKPHLSWWPEEMMSLGDVYRVAEDGHADIMVTHDAPGPPTPSRASSSSCATIPAAGTPPHFTTPPRDESSSPPRTRPSARSGSSTATTTLPARRSSNTPTAPAAASCPSTSSTPLTTSLSSTSTSWSSSTASRPLAA
ncbi:metallophosphoesterase [Paenarthrobacter sp. C1]|uniref:metallophosphoesterase n=1 Tax=Paenarthrobacter sp. C1 TaxID=3400220 RepID=UPI003BF5A03C